MNVLGVLLSYWVSLTVVWVARDSSLTSREYWAGGWFFGWPLWLLAPIYLSIMRRLPRQAWLLALAGATVAPVPLLLLIVTMGSLQDAMTGHESWHNHYRNPAFLTLYAPWYAGFGLLLGLWSGLVMSRVRRRKQESPGGS